MSDAANSRSQVMLLCAGHGTRLRPLTSELPKPLVPLGDRPLLAHLTRQLVTAGVPRVALNAHHLSDKFTNLNNQLGIEADVIIEHQILGTAGGVAGARTQLSAPVLVWNGDILCRPPIAELLAQRQPMTLLVAPREIGQGSVGLGVGGRVVRLRGEVFGRELRGGDYVGIAVLGQQVLDDLPAQGCLIGDVALPRLRASLAVDSLGFAGEWSDLGSLERYLGANLEWLGGAASWIGAGAQVADSVILERSLVGSGARVSGAGRLQRCVVWPGAAAQAPASDCIFGRHFQVHVDALKAG